MKSVFALAMVACTQAGELARPVTDDFLWINEQNGLTKVAVKGETHPFDSTAV